MKLHGGIRRIAYQAIGAVVTHRHLIRQFFGYVDLIHLIHLCGGFVDEQPQHFCLGLKLYQRELDALIG